MGRQVDARVTTFLLAALDHKIKDDNWKEMPRGEQGTALAAAVNKEFPRLNAQAAHVTSRLRKLHSQYRKVGIKSRGIFHEGSGCLNIERFDADKRQLFCQARKRLGLPEIPMLRSQSYYLEPVRVLFGRLRDRQDKRNYVN
jgi:hypothetical protein